MDSAEKELTIPIAHRGKLYMAQLQKRHRISSAKTESPEYEQQFLTNVGTGRTEMDELLSLLW